MSDCRFGVSPVNYPDPDPDPGTGVVFIYSNISKSEKHSALKGEILCLSSLPASLTNIALKVTEKSSPLKDT